MIIIGILLFELIIFVHELGHFITAKKSGIKVNEFALGMGPRIFSFKKGETAYSLRLLPIGGFCAMEGEDEESDTPGSFNNAKIWKRMIVIIAGAVMNILLGVILMFTIVVQQDSYASTTIDKFSPNSFSANSGLQSGDVIKKIDGYAIYNARDLTFAVGSSQLTTADGGELKIYKQDVTRNLCDVYVEIRDDKAYTDKQVEEVYKILEKGVVKVNAAVSKEEAKALLNEYTVEMGAYIGKNDIKTPEITEKETRQRYRADIEVKRGGENVTLKDVDFYTYLEEGNDTPQVSIDFYLTSTPKTFFTVISESFGQTVSVVRMIWSSLVGMIQGKYGIKDVAGPVGMVKMASQVASAGLDQSFMAAVNNIILMMVILTTNLGIVNMMPFPALDGGRFVLLLIEAIRKKPIPRKYEAYINGAGLALLLLLMLLITVKDVWQIFTGG